MAKANKELTEFIKFWKSFYTNYIQLNFGTYFILNYKDNKTELLFPGDSYFKINGTIILDEMPDFYTWLSSSECSVKINNDELDALRKIKLGSFTAVDHDDQSYTISYKDPDDETKINKFVLVKEKYILNNDFNNYKFIYSIDVPDEEISSSSIIVSLKNNALYFGESDNIVVDVPTKVLLNIFKKNATYNMYITDTDGEFRYTKFEAKSDKCIINQYFKVI